MSPKSNRLRQHQSCWQVFATETSGYDHEFAATMDFAIPMNDTLPLAAGSAHESGIHPRQWHCLQMAGTSLVMG
jgi:hypothetical protein